MPFCPLLAANDFCPQPNHSRSTRRKYPPVLSPVLPASARENGSANTTSCCKSAPNPPHPEETHPSTPISLFPTETELRTHTPSSTQCRVPPRAPSLRPTISPTHESGSPPSSYPNHHWESTSPRFPANPAQSP